MGPAPRPEMPQRGNDPRAAPSVRNSQSRALSVRCASAVSFHIHCWNVALSYSWIFPGIFTSPCCSSWQCSPPWYLPAPDPGQCPLPLPSRSVSLQPAASRTHSRKGRASNIFSFLPSFFFSPQSWARVCDCCSLKVPTHNRWAAFSCTWFANPFPMQWMLMITQTKLLLPKGHQLRLLQARRVGEGPGSLSECAELSGKQNSTLIFFNPPILPF